MNARGPRLCIAGRERPALSRARAVHGTELVEMSARGQAPAAERRSSRPAFDMRASASGSSAATPRATTTTARPCSANMPASQDSPRRSAASLRATAATAGSIEGASRSPGRAGADGKGQARGQAPAAERRSARPAFDVRASAAATPRATTTTARPCSANMTASQDTPRRNKRTAHSSVRGPPSAAFMRAHACQPHESLDTMLSLATIEDIGERDRSLFSI